MIRRPLSRIQIFARPILVALLALALAPSIALAKPKTDEEKTLYFIGTRVAASLGELNLSKSEVKFVVDAFSDQLRGKAMELDENVYGPRLQALVQERRTAALEIERKEAASFVANAAAQKGASQTASGLVYTELKAGSGEQPKLTDQVKVHYEGKLRDGTVFDSSLARGQAAQFPLSGVVECWKEGVGLMKVGGRAKLVCPPEIAYGDRGAPPRIPPGAALSFEVELLEIVR